MDLPGHVAIDWVFFVVSSAVETLSGQALSLEEHRVVVATVQTIRIPRTSAVSTPAVTVSTPELGSTVKIELDFLNELEFWANGATLTFLDHHHARETTQALPRACS
jgi:hypothetical protein